MSAPERFKNRSIELHSIASFSCGLVVNLVEYVGNRQVSFGQWLAASLEG